MRVVVTGASGNVGTGVVAALARDPAVDEVVGVARREVLDLDQPKVRHVAADVAEEDLEPILRGADAVVHLAWLFQPTHRPEVTWRANAIGSGRVFRAAGRAGVRALVHASSVGAYSPRHDDVPVDETWPTDSLPTAGYGREKAYAERLLDAFEAEHPEVRVVRMRPGFIFQRASATQQRRLFAGPLLPAALVRPGRLPVVPVPAGLRFQALHQQDAADAYRRAVLSDARGAFNVAAEPVMGAAEIAAALGARPVGVPATATRAALSALWHLHAVPASPQLFDLVMRLPVMATERARQELGWQPRFTGVEALREALFGMADGAGGPTAPLAPDSPAGRIAEIATGVGERP
ncbi:MAG: NAD-dependent epimerase/dehydratase family protein [Actinobacteria bacterium]|nr:NAD-dependent epimerase/dehydratase family protein [Actinomycetota bacterium]